MTTRRSWHLHEKALAAAPLGYALAQTMMATLVPVLLAQHTSSTAVIGMVMASEGACALILPYVVGNLSDRMGPWWRERFGRRLPFLLIAAPGMALVLVLVPFLDTVLLLALATLVFFALLHATMTPHLALLTDQVPRERWGEVQGFRAGAHALALVLALGVGGVLFATWQGLPFVLAAGMVLLMTGLAWAASRPRCEEQAETSRPDGWLPPEARRPEVRWYLVANTLWTGAVDGVRPYIFLYATVVLGLSMSDASLLLVPMLGAVGIGALVIGRLSDRFGRARVLQLGTLILGLALIPGILVRTPGWAAVVLTVAGIGGAAVLALPYAAFMDLAGEEDAGRRTGMFVMSDGLAHLVAPVALGVVIDVARPWLPDSEGYPAMWPVMGIAALLSVAALQRAETLRARAADAPG